MMTNKDLILAKTHDYCKADEPKLAAVMLHGIATDSADYDDALKFLEKNKSLDSVRFVTFDLLGSGKSMKDDSLEYGYDDQLKALHNSIAALDLTVPLVLIGHSLGTFIVTRYADTYKNSVKALILLSPPIYTEADFDNPVFATQTKVFRDVVGMKSRKILSEKSFNNSMDKIVMNRDNYKVLASLKTPAILVYGKNDQLIAPYNIPELLAKNPNLTGVETTGRHGISKDKYLEVEKILERMIDA